MNLSRARFVGGALALTLSLGGVARAEPTRFHTYEGFANFLDGDAKNTSLSANGQIELAPALKRLFEEKDGRLSAVAELDGKVALAFATSGRLVVVDDAGKKTEWGEAPKGVITSLLLTKSALYVATAGPAALLKFSAPGKSEVMTLPELQKRGPAAVWDMVDTKKGLVIATGAPGSLYRLEGGKFVELFKSSEDLLRSVSVDAQGTLFVGGGSKGIVYRGSEKGSFVAHFDSGLDEITDLLPVGEGEVFVVGLGGAQHKGDTRQDRVAEKGKIRSQLVHVDGEGFADVLAGSDDEILYAVSPAPNGRVYVATGSVDKENLRGRLYAMNPKTREISLVYQTEAAQLIAVAGTAKKVTLVSNDPPAVDAVTDSYAKEGEFMLPVFDAQGPARYGSVQLDAVPGSKGQVVVRLRTGQVSTPDNTWTPWSKDIAVGIAAGDLTPGRFVQAKLVLRGDGSSSPQARRVRLAYGRNNLPPYIGEVTLLPKGVALSSLPGDSSRDRTVTLNDKGLQELKRVGEPSGDGLTKVRQTMQEGVLSVAWAAQDPNGDELVYDLYVRSASDSGWRLLKARIEAPFYTMNGSSLADGRYQFKVTASDEPSNAPGEVKSESRESLWFTHDNAPPKLSKIEVQKKRALVFTAEDAHSVLVRAEYALDGSPLRPLAAKDGLVDSQKEAFEVTLPINDDKPHVVTVRLQDEAGNVASGDVRF